MAEVSSNHNSDLERSKEFIRVAAATGCQAVKFQLFKLNQLFAPEAITANPSLKEREQWELPLDFIPVLSGLAHTSGLEFSCTPFYLDAVDELQPYVDFYKIASYELLWNDLLVKVAAMKKPVVLSTGMAEMHEIAGAVEMLRKSGCTDLTLLQCVSGYPTPVDEANLSVIQTLREKFRCHAGWSDHSVSPAVIYRAIHKWDASMVEFHLDLEGKGKEFETGHCWLPGEIREVISTIRNGSLADGSGEKKPAPSELPDRAWRADPTDGLRPLKETRNTL